MTEIPKSMMALTDSARLPKVSGIYFVWDVAGALAYVGQSGNLFNRVRTRHDRVQPGDTVSWIECPPEELDWREAYYIHHAKPSRNWTRISRAGRPGKVQPLLRVTVTISQDDINTIYGLGYGNVSAGIRAIAKKLREDSAEMRKFMREPICVDFTPPAAVIDTSAADGAKQCRFHPSSCVKLGKAQCKPACKAACLDIARTVAEQLSNEPTCRQAEIPF